MALSRSLTETILKHNISADDVVSVLRKYNLLALLPFIKRDIEKLSRDEDTRETILIESPFDVDAEALSRIKRITGNDLAQSEVTINKNIFAGFKARYKGKLYDGSAERIIKKLISN